MSDTDRHVIIDAIDDLVVRAARQHVFSSPAFIRQASLVAVIILGLLASACSASQSAPASPSATTASTSSTPTPQENILKTNPYATTPSQSVAVTGMTAPTASSPDVPNTLLTHLQKGRPYSAFRHQALANGWQPVPTAMCKANVVGDNYKSLCASHPGMNSCQLCDRMPELNACSGDGYCQMQFRHVGTPEIMRVTTYGDTRNWTRTDSGLRVTDWAFFKTPEQ